MNRLLKLSGIALSCMVIVVASGCASMVPTPTMPSIPAQVGGKRGLAPEVELACRQQAQQAAEQTKQQNVGREAVGIVAGAAVGALAGRALSPTTYSYHGGYYRYLGGGYYGYAPSHIHGYRQDLAPLGGAAGAVVGSQMAQAGNQDLQTTFDIVYNNCVEQNKAVKRR